MAPCAGVSTTSSLLSPASAAVFHALLTVIFARVRSRPGRAPWGRVTSVTLPANTAAARSFASPGVAGTLHEHARASRGASAARASAIATKGARTWFAVNIARNVLDSGRSGTLARMRALFVVLGLLAVVTLAGDAGACGAFFMKPPRPLTEQELAGQLPFLSVENVMLVWDRATETEDFVREARFAKADQKFGFVVPTPTRPEVFKVDGDPFKTLRDAYPYDPPLPPAPPGGLRGIGAGGAGAAPGNGAPPPVVVLSQQRIGSFTASVEASGSTPSTSTSFSCSIQVRMPLSSAASGSASPASRRIRASRATFFTVAASMDMRPRFSTRGARLLATVCHRGKRDSACPAISSAPPVRSRSRTRPLRASAG